MPLSRTPPSVPHALPSSVADPSAAPLLEPPQVSQVQLRALLDPEQAQLLCALQPVVNIHTGGLQAYQALLSVRGSPPSLDWLDAGRDRAWREGLAEELDDRLLAVALAHFVRAPEASRHRLLVPCDGRLLPTPGRIDAILARIAASGLRLENLALQLAECAEAQQCLTAGRALRAQRDSGLGFAIAGFGRHVAGLRLLYDTLPNGLSLDADFIADIDRGRKKRRLIAQIAQTAHALRISVTADGISRETQLCVCREAGCDLAQGAFIAQPARDPEQLALAYPQVNNSRAQDRRHGGHDREMIREHLAMIPALHITNSVKHLFEAFRRDALHHVIPVLDMTDRPLGLVYEVDIKELVYSNYGRDLIVNRAFARKLADFIRPTPVVDIHEPVDRLLHAYSTAHRPAGLLITSDGRYQGFISATALLQLIDRKKVAEAADQNPLTKLPGNNPIHRVVSNALLTADRGWHLVYLDFDNFKAFNDHYGFRRGDRAILMFADLLRRELEGDDWFIGHVGGDDFFAAIQGAEGGALMAQLQRLLAEFRTDVQSLYDPEDRLRGYIAAHDRYGQARQLPLLRCSAAVIEIQRQDDFASSDELGRVIAGAKLEAKRSDSGLLLHPGSQPPPLEDDRAAAPRIAAEPPTAD